MLTIYKSTEQGLQALENAVNGGWIKAVDPTPEEIQQLIGWGIDPDLINYSLDQDEMARMERDEGYVFILLRVPYFQGAGTDIPYITVPLGIILADRFVITVCKFENDVTRVLCNGKYRGLKTAKRYRFALYIFLETAARYLSHLREINKTTAALEDRLEQSTRNREVLELLKVQKSLVYFTTGLRSNQVVMERLQRSRMFNHFEEDDDLLEDVLTENQQAIGMTDIQTNILAGLMDAFASIISNNLNSVMKVLAALTIVINIPTIVASFYGMNVSLPGENSPLAFLSILGISLALVTIAVLIFARRDWF
ncbi:MAG: magnesium transporter CorA family protein [Anaerolineales bacterium]|nr:magnesium transporter CorA family protein [Anaerolineales bacterium]